MRNDLLFAISFLLLGGVSLFATSIYTIGHGSWNSPCPLNAFELVDDQIVRRDGTVLPSHGVGAIALTIDELTNTLFVTFEYDTDYHDGGNIIELVNAHMFEHKTIVVDGVHDLTGIVFDPARRQLYATDRNTNLLHILSYDPILQTVCLNDTVQLTNIEFACGLSLHGDLLYVSEFRYIFTPPTGYYSHVKCYRISQNFH